MKRDLAKYQQEYAVSPFEETMAGVRKRMLLDFLGHHAFRDVLEVGCAEKPLFNELTDFNSFTTVEPGRDFFAKAQAAARSHPAHEKIKVVHALFEDYPGHAPLDCIIISSLLHELPDPSAMLQHAFRIATPGCWIHVNVPNAKSFHRLWARESALIKSEYDKSATQIRMQQNQTYDLDGLTALIRSSGFSVIESGSYFIKPFTHAQMQQLMDIGLLSDALIAGLSNMEQHLPGLGAEIFVNARK